MLYLDKYSNRRLMKGREHPHLLLSTITANLFVYAQAFEFFFFKFAARNAGFLREVTVNQNISFCPELRFCPGGAFKKIKLLCTQKRHFGFSFLNDTHIYYCL